MASIGKLAAAAKKKAEEEAKKKEREAKAKAAAAQKAAQKEQTKVSDLTAKAKTKIETGAAKVQQKAQTSTAKPQNTRSNTNTNTKSNTNTKAQKANQTLTGTTPTRTGGAKELVREAKRQISDAGTKRNRANYSRIETKFATDWTARQNTRNNTMQYSRRQKKDDQWRWIQARRSAPSLDELVPRTSDRGDVSRYYFRSGVVDPLALAKADGITGRNPATSSPRLSKEARERVRSSVEQTRKEEDRISRIPTSKADQRNLNESELDTIRRQRDKWEKAMERGDTAAARRAHAEAERVRNRAGYSGGDAGEAEIGPKLSLKDRLNLNKEGERALRGALYRAENGSNSNRGSSGDGDALKRLTRQKNGETVRSMDKELWDRFQGAAQAARVRGADRYKSGIKKHTDRERERSEERRRILATGEGPVDAHGRPLPGDNGDAWRSYARVEAAGYGAAGGLVKAAEAVANAARNNRYERMRGEWERMAAKIPEYQGQLRAYYELEAQGYKPSANKDVLYKQLQAANYAKEQLEQMSLDPRSDWFDPTQAQLRGMPTTREESLGDRWIRTGQEQRDLAVKGLGPVGTFLTDTAISGYQMLPSVAATALIPGAGAAAGAALMGGQAMGQKAYEVEQNGGYTSGETFLRALGSGAIETATEAIPLHRLAKIAKGATGRKVLSNILTQSGVEGTEEAVAYLGNYAADWAAKDPNRELSLAGLAENALAGAMLGGVFGGAASIAGYPARGGSNVPEAGSAPAALPPGRLAALPEGVRNTDPIPPGSPLAEAAADVAQQRSGQGMPDGVRQQMTRVRERLAQQRAAQVPSAPVQTPSPEVQAMREPGRRETPSRRLSATASERDILARNISALGRNGRNAILSSYREGSDLSAYRRGFQSVYDQALTGAADEDIRVPSSLDVLQAKAAVDAGRNDRTINLERERQKAENAKVSKKGGLRDYDQIAQVVGKDQAKTLNEVGRMLGREVRYVSAQEMENPRAQGEERADGIIQINRDYETVTGDAPDAVRWIMGHELFHTMKRISPEHSRSFQDAIMQDEENQRRVDAVLEAYQRSGAEISRDEVMEEIAADLSGDIFNEESDFLERFIERNRSNQNVLTRLWQAIKDFAARLTGKRKQRANEAMTLLENAMDETVRRAKDLPGVDATDRNVGGKARQSFAGRNARTANIQRLSDAQAMEQNGQDNESIRQETGWHKGRDGKWRFEIDDSQMQYFPDGDARFRQAHPEYAEYQELYQKLFDGTLTDAERPRLERLEDLWGNELGRLSARVERGEATLDNIIQHEALFEAYPELRNVRIEYQDMDDGVSGTHYPKNNKIVLNSDDLAESQKSALLHEVQHAIQHIEGFSPGTSTKAYERTRKELEDAVRDVEHNRDLWLKDAGVPDFVRESMEQVRQGKRTIQEHFAALDRFKQESKYAEEIAASEEDVRRARERLGEYGTPYDRYKRTAGEIEARDTQARRKLTAEERKNTAPDLGGENTLFAEGDGPSSLIDPDFAEDVQTWDKKGRPDGETFVLGSTGSVLQGLGAIENDIYIQGDKIKDILTEHREMTVREVQQIPGILEDPVLILKSQNKGRGGRQNTRMVLYGSVRAQNGEPVLTVLDLRPVENGLVIEDMQKVSSAYTKTTNPTDFVRKSEVVHVDKKRAIPLLRTIGFQTPIELQRNGSVGSISYIGQNVNISGLPFSAVVQEKPAENNPDIRFSIKSPGVTGQDAAALVRENRELREKLEHWKAQVKRTDRRDVDPKSLRQLARRLRKDYSTDMDTDAIAGRLGEIYNGITHDMEYGQAQDLSQRLAGDMIAQARETEDYLYHEYEPMRKYFRETPVVLSPEDAGQITDYNDFRKAMFGKLRIKSGEQSNVDQVYQEISTLWPEWFDEGRESNSLDQVERIAEVLDEIYSRDDVNPYAGDMSGPANFLASEIMESFWDAPAVKKTFADRQQERVDEANAGKARMAKRWHDSVRAREEAEMNARWREAELKATHEWLSAKDKHERKKKYDAAIRAVREQRDRKIRQEQEKRREQKKQMQTRQKERELRARVIRHSRDLSGKLLRPSDAKHIPQQLRTAVASVLESINLESVYTYDPVTGRRSKNPNGTPAKRTQAFQELRLAYEAIRREGEELVLDPDLMDNISAVEGFRDRPITSLGLEELTTIWNTVKAVESSISTANKALGQQRFATIQEASEGLRQALQGRKSKKEFSKAVGAMDKLLNAGMIRPHTYYHGMGETGDALFHMMRQAQDKHISFVDSAEKHMKELRKGINPRKLENGTRTFTFDGAEITLSKAEIMSLYELMKRPEATEHILIGGTRAEGKAGALGRRTKADPVRLSPEQIGEITGTLTEEEIRLADGIQKYMSDTLAKWGNEASMAVYGYEKFTDPNYFPMQVDRNQVVKDVANDAQSATIAGRGFTKATKPHANNALVIRSIFDVAADHISDMATYAAWLEPMENMKRIYNFSFRNEAGERTGTVKALIENAYGKNGLAYWDRLMEDLNNGIKGTDDNPFNAFVGNYKASAIGANIRVFIQQPTSILRALEEINPADFLAGFAKARPGTWKKVKQYAPIAIWKDWGYFDANTGRQMRSVLFDDDSPLRKLSNAAVQPASFMDSIAWSHLWNALEVETRRKHRELKPNTKEFYEAVAERFNEVIDSSQVVDGILQRSQVMRSPDSTTKMATSFMAEPTITYNMLYRAASDLRNAQTPQERGKAIGRMGRVTFAVAVSLVANAAAQSLVDGLRDDDEDEDYWEKFTQAFTGLTGEEESVEEAVKNAALEGNIGNAFNPAGYLPFAKDLLSIVQGYKVTRMDMDSFARLAQEAGNVMTAMDGKGKRTRANALASFLAEGSRLLGLPVANLKRDVLAVYKTWLRGRGQYEALYAVAKTMYRLDSSNNAGTFLDLAYAARRAGDMDAYEHITKELMDSQGKDQKWLEGKMTDRLAADGELEGIQAQQYQTFTREVGQIESDKDENGKTITGSKQKKIIAYIDGLDLSREQKSALFRTQYDSDKNNPWK